MCGIVGYITKDSTKHQKELKEIMRKLLLASQTRGRDATGVAGITADRKLYYLKDGVTAKKFVEYPEFRNMKMPNILIGHTRNGTHGTPKDNKNNHPLISKESKMAVTHNGVVHNYEVNKGQKLPLEGECDSEIILRIIEDELTDINDKPQAIEDSVSEGMERLSGSITFALVGERFANKLILVASSNPLSICFVEELDTIFYASTEAILEKGLCEDIKLFNYIKVKKSTYTHYIQEVDDDTMLVLEAKDNGFKIDEYSIKQKERAVYTSADAFTNSEVSEDRDTDNERDLYGAKFPEVPKGGHLSYNPKTLKWEPVEGRGV